MKIYTNTERKKLQNMIRDIVRQQIELGHRFNIKHEELKTEKNDLRDDKMKLGTTVKPSTLISGTYSPFSRNINPLFNIHYSGQMKDSLLSLCPVSDVAFI